MWYWGYLSFFFNQGKKNYNESGVAYLSYINGGGIWQEIKADLIKPNEDYTLSLLLGQEASVRDCPCYIEFWNKSVKVKAILLFGNTGYLDLKRRSYTFKTINEHYTSIRLVFVHNGSSNGNGCLQVGLIKLEKGNKAGDWSIAPEDTDKLIGDNIKIVTDKITTVESTLVQKTNSIEAGVRDLNSTTQTITINVSNLNRDLTSKINSNLDVAKNFATDIATNKANTAKQEALNSAKAFINAEITTINSKVHNVESNLNILSDRINSKVSQSDIDKSISNIKLGGRNLLINTLFSRDKTPWKSINFTTFEKYSGIKEESFLYKGCVLTYSKTDGVAILSQSINIKTGLEHTLSFYDFTDRIKRYWIGIYYKIDNVVKYITFRDWEATSTAWKKRVYKFTIPQGATEIELKFYHYGVYNEGERGGLWIANLKLEEGSKCSDWTPAPEDTNSLIADNIKIVNSKISDVSSSLEQTKNSITQSVNNLQSQTTTLNGKIVNAETRLNSVEAKITDTAIINTVRREFYSKGETDNMYSSKTEVTQLSNSLEWKISTLGAGNIIKNSSFEGGFDCWEKFRNPTLSTNTDFLPDRYGKMISIEGDGGIYQRFPTIVGEKYTVSFYAEANQLKPLATTIGIEGINLITLKFEPGWKRWSFTFTATSKEHTFIAYLGQYGKFYLGRVMVTQGSILQEYREGLGIYSNIAKFDTNGFTVESSSTNTRTITDSAGFRVQDKRTGENLLEANTKGVSARGGRFYVDGPNGNYTLMWGRDIVINGQRAIVGTHSHPEASLKANKMYLNYNNDFRNGVEIAGDLTNNTFPIPSLIGAIKGENGFRKLSDGFMIVWGKAVMPIKEGKVIEGTIPFHTKFPNACFLFNAKLAKVDGNDYWAGNYTLNSYPLDKFGGRVYGLNMQKYISTQGAWADVYYFAIGC